MRLLHIVGSVNPETGGPIEAIVRLKELTEDVVDHEVASLDSPHALFLATSAVKTHALGDLPRQSYGWTRPLARYGYSPELVPWLKQNIRNYDCAIVHGLWNYSKYAASVVLRNAGVPYFVFVHGMMDPWFRKRHPLKHLVKQVSWLLFEGPLLAGAQAALFTTEEERQVSRGVFYGFKYRERVVRLGTTEPPPPSQAQIDAFRARVPDLGGRPMFLYLSRIHTKKGCDLLIEAFAAAVSKGTGLDLVIAGPDEMNLQARLHSRAKQHGIASRVHWPGMLLGDEKWGAYRSAEAFILPSHQENFGIVVAESLACGTPVLLTNKVQIWREVASSNAGLVENDDLPGVSRLLDRFLLLTGEERAQMRRQARQCFRAHLDIRATRDSFLELLSSAAPMGSTR